MAIVGLLLIGSLLAAGPAQAVLAGENGRIVLISGRAPQTDATSLPYLLPVPSNSVGGGTLSAPIAAPGGQYRHPTWSPDRTRIAYANGDPTAAGGGLFDIFVQDLTTGQIFPITDFTDNLSADRPAWSPDGTKIAYEHQPSAGSADRHIRVQSALDLTLPIATTDLTAAGAPFEGKPAWTPDSSTVYFHRGDPNTTGNSDIYRKPATGGTETLAIPDSGISEAQPSISPDGTRICFTLTKEGFNSSADVVVAPLANPSSGVVVSKDVVKGDYNCTWSPDGQMIAYVNGTFSTGRLVMVRADNTSLLEIELAEAPGFDGNPDWAPDGRPLCPDPTVTTLAGQAVTFSVECTDTGPEYEQSEVREYADSQPKAGTLAQELAGDPFTYTPNPGFVGTDSFEVNSFDALGFGADRGTVTIQVVAPGGGGGAVPPTPKARCGGEAATIVGTAGKDTLKGTKRRDVIAGLGGNDRILGVARGDLLCGGAGNDRIVGGAGNDRLLGHGGKDVLLAGPGLDRLNGGAGPDRLFGGGGRDECRGGAGSDLGQGCEIAVGIP